MKNTNSPNTCSTFIKALGTSGFVVYYFSEKIFLVLKKGAMTPAHPKWKNQSIALAKIAVAYGVAEIIWYDLVLFPSIEDIIASFQGKVEFVENTYDNRDQLQSTIEEAIDNFSWDTVTQIPWKIWEGVKNMTLYQNVVLYIEVSVFGNMTSYANNAWAGRNRTLSAVRKRGRNDENFRKKFLASQKYFRKKRKLEREARKRKREEKWNKND